MCKHEIICACKYCGWFNSTGVDMSGADGWCNHPKRKNSNGYRVAIKVVNADNCNNDNCPLNDWEE